MSRYRLSKSAQQDIADALTWSYDHFGAEAEQRYAALIAAAIRHAAVTPDTIGFRWHPAYGDGVMTWHLALSVSRSATGPVKNPRHVLVCRREDEVLAIGRVLHESMDPLRHLDAAWQ